MVIIKFILLGIFILLPLMVSGQGNPSDQKPETYEMEWLDSTVVMQKYFVAFLKKGPNRDQQEKEAARIQKEHLTYLEKLYKEGKTSLTGPFDDEGEISGMIVFNTATIEEAERLANRDPAVLAGRVTIEMHPWWSIRGGKLR